MARTVGKNDAQRALALLIRRDIDTASPNNDIVSKDESSALHPFVQRAEAQVRSGKQAYGRVRTDEVVDQAMRTAMTAWNGVNPRSNPRDHKNLSQAEIRALKKRDPELADLSLKAYQAVRTSQPRDVMQMIDTQSGFGGLFRRTSSFGTAIDARPGQPGRNDLPAQVLAGFDAHYAVEQADLGTATVKQFSIAQQEVYSIYSTTDGDDQRLELYSLKGEPIASARYNADQFIDWDTHFGLGRFEGVTGRLGHPLVEGLSEDIEAAAAGQITNQWVPDIVFSQADLHHAQSRVTSISLGPNSGSPEQREVAHAVLELAYERTLRIAGDGFNPISLPGFGQVRVGEHFDQVTGENYIVGDWADIDDAPSTFYFQRDANNQLFIAREQYN